jgi:hypothetical protein
MLPCNGDRPLVRARECLDASRQSRAPRYAEGVGSGGNVRLLSHRGKCRMRSRRSRWRVAFAPWFPLSAGSDAARSVARSPRSPRAIRRRRPRWRSPGCRRERPCSGLAGGGDKGRRSVRREGTRWSPSVCSQSSTPGHSNCATTPHVHCLVTGGGISEDDT